MSFDPDRRELRRALLERVAEAQLAFEQAREDLRHDAESVAVFDRTIAEERRMMSLGGAPIRSASSRPFSTTQRPRSHSSSCQPSAPSSSTPSSATTMVAFCTRSRFTRAPKSPARRHSREFTH